MSQELALLHFYTTGSLTAYAESGFSTQPLPTTLASFSEKTLASEHLTRLLNKPTTDSNSNTKLHTTLYEKTKWQGDSAPVPPRTDTFEMKKMVSKPS